LYPEAFALPVRPLAVGVASIILKAPRPEDIFGRQLRVSLSFWTNSDSYLQAVANGQRRVHLDGSDADEITDDHKADALKRLAERRRAARRVKKKQYKKRRKERLNNEQSRIQ
jgi:sRNA-binding protein